MGVTMPCQKENPILRKTGRIHGLGTKLSERGSTVDQSTLYNKGNPAFSLTGGMRNRAEGRQQIGAFIS